MSEDNLLSRRRRKDLARIDGLRTLDDENICTRCGVPDVHCQCDDIVDQLRSPSFPMGQRFALCREAADEIVRLRAELADMSGRVAAWTDTARQYARNADYWEARARRAEADADRLAAEVMRLMCACGPHGYVCTKCVALDLHDREVEAR